MMNQTTEQVNGRNVPTSHIRSAHVRADATGVEHAVMFLTGDVGGSDGRFGEWFVVPRVPAVLLAGSRIDVTDEMWNAAPYVAIPGEEWG